MTDRNPPAFPVPPSIWDSAGNVSHPPHDGMSLRDWFAGQIAPALAGAIARENGMDGELAAIVARDAYRIADAMLAERAK